MRFDESAFYDHAKRAVTHYETDPSRRHHAASLRDFIRWMDRSGSKEGERQSPGAKAAAKAGDK